ncbi:hypothetical protein DKG34_08040 [Streptomyces sp. NWU49]|nr:hypothetical protein DKG34_08040 [Streptomyces sp. NWU49]
MRDGAGHDRRPGAMSGLVDDLADQVGADRSRPPCPYAPDRRGTTVDATRARRSLPTEARLW